jgi:cullin-associated NEDD8-dissociated protein 1
LDGYFYTYAGQSEKFLKQHHNSKKMNSIKSNSKKNKDAMTNFLPFSPSSPSSFKKATSPVSSPTFTVASPTNQSKSTLLTSGIHHDSKKKRKLWMIAAGIFSIVGISAGIGTWLALRNSSSSSSAEAAESEILEIPTEISVGNQAVDLAPGKLYSLPISKPDQIYYLYRKSTDPNVLVDTPAARSYDGNAWEPVFPLAKDFNCTGQGQACLVKILSGEGDFVVVPAKASAFKSEEMVADFLIQTTFGPTRDAIANFPKGDTFKDRAKAFIINEMDAVPTIHRSYYRRFVNQLAYHEVNGKVRGPCEVGSRWERAWLDNTDSIKVIKRIGDAIYVNDEFRSQVTPDVISRIPENTPYYLCYISNSPVSKDMYFTSLSTKPEFGSCPSPLAFTMRSLEFRTIFPNNSQILHQNADFLNLDIEIDGNVKILKSTFAGCTASTFGRNYYAKDAQGIWYRYQTRIQLLRNSVENPNLDMYPQVVRDSPAPKDFINENGCKILNYKERCGSPGETENNPLKGNQYFFSFSGERNSEYLDLGQIIGEVDLNPVNSKSRVWTNVAITAKDQLRQRTAWALSQIFVATIVNVNRERATELWLKYYDIFVRNAFGNYFDVMKEVSYSPVMGRMLSYLGNKAFEATKIKPDENYAREIMQLFSIGLVKLHRNGTSMIDASGKVLETYTTLDIQNFARVWTGFVNQPVRGNVELDEAFNLIDPMKIVVGDHDSLPKNALDNGHLGDGYPLCKNLPSKSFLRKGAKYRYLGSSLSGVSNAEQVLLVLDKASNLNSALCNVQIDGSCDLKSTVYLQNNLQCSGLECDAQFFKIVEVVVDAFTKVYYQYERTPCVELEFPEAGVATYTYSKQGGVCVDKESARASPMCCPKTGNVNTPSLSTKFLREMTSFKTAEERCSAVNQVLCYFDFTASSQVPDSRVWTQVPCNVGVQVFDDGQVSIVHSFSASQATSSFTHLSSNSGIQFRVNWMNKAFPTVSTNCDGICTVQGNTCVCPTRVVNSAVFDRVDNLPSKSELLQTLRIGAPDPLSFDSNEYSIAYQNASQGVTVFVDSSKALNSKSIFRIVVAGSEVVHLANVKSDVYLGELYKFRNPPNFMRHGDKTLFDAQNEVDAFLKHLLYHPNTAPFVADFMIKRFVSSNPSPAYIEQVATAFINGNYEGIGSGKVGDLAATVAATLLYRDAWAPALKSDATHGKMREPLLKVIHLMRSLEMVSQKKREFELYRLNELLAQEPYFSPTVFNYYDSKFQPNSAVKRADLFAPEAQLLTFPRIASFLNVMYNMIEFGLVYCYDSLGLSFRPVNCNALLTRTVRPNDVNSAYLSYNSSYLNVMNASEIIQNFNLLLTGGRLDASRKNALERNFLTNNAAFSREDAVKILLESFITTPEYQISTLAKAKPVQRASAFESFKPSANANDYKAIFFFYLHGGMDSFNLIIPHSECGAFDLQQQYQNVRTNIAYPKETLLTVDIPSWSPPQPCQKFGIHQTMPFFKKMYDDGELAYLANIGPMVEPVVAKDYFNPKSSGKKLPVSLFAHDVQTMIANTLRADVFSSNGVLGRIRDQYSLKKVKTSSFSAQRNYAPILEESPGVSESQFILNPYTSGGVELLDEIRLSRGKLNDVALNLTSDVSESIFADTWNEALNSGLKRAKNVKGVLKDAKISTNFQGRVFTEYIARAIASRSVRNSSLDVFSLVYGGFDTHDSNARFHVRMAEVDLNLRLLATELKAQGVWDQTLIVLASEFGRTLRSNGVGTDHGWGGNTVILGGSVKGGQMLGKFPSNLEDPVLHLGNGILVPTTPWEGMWNGIAQWVGITQEQDLNKVLPNRKNFLNGTYLFTKEQLFKK